MIFKFPAKTLTNVCFECFALFQYYTQPMKS